MMTDFTLTDADVGRAPGVPDGYLANLSVTTMPVFDGSPRWSESKRCWVSGYFVLRRALDIRDLISLSPLNGGSLSWSGSEGSVTNNTSLCYRGELVVVAVPRVGVELDPFRRAKSALGRRPRHCPQRPDGRFARNMQRRQLGEAARA